jgi:hypothetical protein
MLISQIRNVMKKVIYFILLVSSVAFSQINFNKYFDEGALRVDIIEAGNANSESIYLKQLIKEPYFSGSEKYLIDNLNLGYYYFYVYSIKDKKLIFSKGFSTLFQEWQTTAEAKKIEKALEYSIRFPFPKDSVRIEILRRGKKGILRKLFSLVIDPGSYFIKQEKRNDYTVTKVHYAGNFQNKLDIVFVPEGYKEEDSVKFANDCNKFKDFLLSYSPFDKEKNNINIWAVNAWSKERGADIPGDSVYKRTLLDASYYTFDSERYLMVENYHNLADVVSAVPYDLIYILVNDSKYGGGAIYNYYNVTCVDNPRSELVFIHELGHGLAGLADEYYTSDVSYEDYYDLSVEPWEKNITTLVDFKSKWKDMLAPGTPVPTPADSIYMDKIGVFEGGGYVAKGVYRPSYNSIMKSLEAKGFNEVSKKAILEVINQYK